MAPVKKIQPTQESWDKLRLRFAGSAFFETELGLLAQNAGLSWPFKGNDETPAKYLSFEFEELNSVPGLVGKRGRVKRLMDILDTTLAFDDPFAHMVDTIKAETDSDSGPEKMLARFGIPQAFPSALIHFGAESAALLRTERLETIGQIVAFSQRNATNTEFPEDFRELINYIAHRNEHGLSSFVPFRIGKRGLHLAEAIGLIARDLPEPVQYEMLHRADYDLIPAEEKIRAMVDTSGFERAMDEASSRIAVACGWFHKEEAELREKIGTAEQMARFFIPLNNPHRERVATVLARLYFGVDVVSGKRGLFSGLKNLFGG